MPAKHSEEFKRDAVPILELSLAQKTVCNYLGISKSALATLDSTHKVHVMQDDPTERPALLR